MKWRPMSLRTCLVLMIVLATVPLVLLTCFLVGREAEATRARQRADLQRLAMSASAAVERELGSSIDAMRALGRLDALARGDAGAFHRALTAQPLLRQSWSSVYLVDKAGDVLLSSDQPLGKPLGNVASMADLERARDGRVPVVSGLRPNVLSGQAQTVIHVPVVVGDEVRYVIGAWIDPGAWRTLLQGAGVPAGDLVALLDASGHLVALNAAADGAIGEPLPAAFANPAPPERVEWPRGGERSLAWQKVATAGWKVMAGTPAGVIDERFRSGLVTAAVGGMLSLIGGLAMALLLARHVAEPLMRLARSGPAGVRGPQPVSEVMVLRDALATLELQRAAANEHLQATADELQALFESSPIGLAIARDGLCQVVQRNPALLAMQGGSAGDGDPPVALRHEGRELAPEQWPLRRAAEAGDVIRDLEIELLRADGRVLKLLAHAQPLLGRDGRPRGAVAGFVDITDRVATERRLRDSRQMVDLAQQAGQVGFFDYDFAADAIAWTAGLGRLLGPGAVETAQGRWQDLLDHLEPEDAAALTAARDAAAERREPELRFECRPRQGAPAHWLAGRALVTYGADGAPSRMIGVAIDVSDHKRAEGERAVALADQREARLEAERANRAKDEFLAMLGHELRNPLGAIAAAAEVLARSPDPAVAASAREIIARQTRHLARMMEDLLDVTRVIAGKITLARQPVDLAAAVERLVSTLEMGQRLSGHRLSLQLEPVRVEADATRLEQIIGNLLTNAIKYTPDEGHVTVTVRRDGDQAVLEVADDGVGMSAQLVDSAFELFVQGERNLDRRQGGLGIGLTLVQRLTELHGGTVSAASDGPDRGSRFTVRLPAMPAEEPTAAPAPALAPMEAVAPKRVVVVEDNADALDALRQMLELDGHVVRTASDGIAGLAMIVQSRPDVALVDVGLPRLDGLEIAARLRARGLKLRLVALSGYGQAEDVDRALAAGFDSHLVKPVDLKALQSELQQV